MRNLLEVLGLSEEVQWGARVLVWMAGAAISLAGCVIDVVGINDGHGGGEVEVSAVFEHRVVLENQTVLNVVGVNGSIVVTGVPGSTEVRVSAVRRVRSHSRADAEGHLHLLQVSVESRSVEVEVETIQPSNAGGRTYIVDYEIMVPEEMELVLFNGNGTAQVGSMKADVVVTNGNGDVTLTDLTGSASVTLGNGRITSQIRLPNGGQILHSAGNGEIDLTVQPQVSARLVAKVGNGSVSLAGLQLHQVTSEPGYLQGTLGTGAGTIDLSLGNGKIEVRGG